MSFLDRVLEAVSPREIVDTIEDIDLDALGDRGIRALIVDLDNTIVPWGETCVSRRLLDWFGSLKEKGMKACIVSNNYGARVEDIGNRCGVPVVAGAVKPRKRAFNEAMALLGSSPGETAVIGDQVLTDVLGANRLKLHSILVTPMTRRDFFLTTFLFRRFEALILRILARRNLSS